MNVEAGTYTENVTVNKSLTLRGSNAGIDPNTGTRVAETIVEPGVTETSLQGSTSGTIFRVGSASGHVNVTIDGFTIDGHNPGLTGGRVLNGVMIDTGAGIINSTGSFDTNPGAFDATMIVISGIVGSGIFINPYVVAQAVGTPFLIVAVWVAGGAIALLGAFVFAELSTVMPRVGGQYAFFREAFHPLVAFLHGWSLLLIVQSGATAAVAVAFATYVAPLVGMPQGMVSWLAGSGE